MLKNYVWNYPKNINGSYCPIQQTSGVLGRWKDLILNKDSILQGINNLNHHIGLTILVNKYDGIDLPENACRLLVIDGLPTARNSIDKIRQSELSGSSNRVNQIVHKVEQGMGRGIRSNDDYCVIFLMGKDLTSQLYMEKPKTISRQKLN